MPGTGPRPPQQTYNVFKELTAETDAALGRFQKLLDEDVVALNAKVQESQLEVISV